jgi:two-component system, response regulator YesN
MSYSVVLVDDEKMVLNSLALAFHWSETDFEVITTYQNSVEALKQILILKPEVVFTDIKMPEMDGLKLMEEVLKKLPHTKFIVISGYEEFTYAKKALTLGAVGYLLKPLEDEEIQSVLRQVKESLVEEEIYLHTIFHSMLNAPSTDNISSFTNYLLKSKGCPKFITLAASVHDISHELEGYTHFYKIQSYADTYLYILDNSDFITSPGFVQRIRQSILREQIKNFCYITAALDRNVINKIEKLLDCIYTYYLHPIDITCKDFAVPEKQIKTDYIELLSTEASKNNVQNVLSLLNNYTTLYPVKDRTMNGIIKIYNITVSLLYRLDGNHFDEPLRNPGELISAFPDIDSVFQYLIVFLRNTTFINNKINMNLIKNDTFKKIIEYIHQNYTSPLNFQSICQTYTINPSYLSQVFKRELGTTFTNYIKNLRISYAKDLLAKTNEPISQICTKVGFDQYFYFSKLFKKETNLTPTQYREQEHRLLKNNESSNSY